MRPIRTQSNFFKKPEILRPMCRKREKTTQTPQEVGKRVLFAVGRLILGLWANFSRFTALSSKWRHLTMFFEICP